tara:strand:+ start:3206 stop:4318 length:1113 start_codon:yes stop_codon:yes gene_type:complete
MYQGNQLFQLGPALLNTLISNVWNSASIQQISNNTITSITPVNGTFQIWGFIYFLLTWYILLPTTRTELNTDFLRSMELNRSWIINFVNLNFEKSVDILNELRDVNSKLAHKEEGLGQFAFDVYHTWTRFAELINQSILNTSYTSEEQIQEFFTFLDSLIGKPLRFGELLTIIWSCAGIFPRLCEDKQILLIRKVDIIIKGSSPSKILKTASSLIMNVDYEKYSSIPYTIHISNISSSHYSISFPEHSITSATNKSKIGKVDFYEYKDDTKTWVLQDTFLGKDENDGIRSEFINDDGSQIILGSRYNNWVQCYEDISGSFIQRGDTIFSSYDAVFMNLEGDQVFLRNSGTYIYDFMDNEWKMNEYRREIE